MMDARTAGAKAYWNHDAFFDYAGRWVQEAEFGTVDRKTLRPTAYDPFAGAGDFIKAMWQMYRPKADEIGGETLRRAATRLPKS